jgi:hypothetical protein
MYQKIIFTKNKVLKKIISQKIKYKKNYFTKK